MPLVIPLILLAESNLIPFYARRVGIYLGYVGVAVAGSMLAISGVITVGDIQAFIQYVRNFTQPITQLAQVSNMLQSMAAASERVFEFLEEPEEDQHVDNPVSIEKVRGSVQFDHVRFGYNPKQPVIHDFTCDVKPGQMVAIVGPTGEIGRASCRERV